MNLIAIFAGLSIILRLVLSNQTLNAMYAYSTEGGSFVGKIHPGTYVAFISLLLCLHTGQLREKLAYIGRNYPNLIGLTLVLLAIGVASALRNGMAGLAYLVDTFFSAIAICIALCACNSNERRHILYAVCTIVGINCILCAIEYKLAINLFPQDQLFSSFRAAGIFGHPLAMGFGTLIAATLLIASPVSTSIKAAFTAIAAVGIMCAGARTAMGVFLLSATFLTLRLLQTSALNARNKVLYFMAGVTGIILFALCFGYVLFETKWGEGLANRLEFDESAQARIDSVSFISSMTTNEFLFGLPESEISFWTANNGSTSIIENFWIVLLLRAGVLLFIPFAFFFLRFCWAVSRPLGPGYSVVFASFVVTASTSNSLAVKSCLFFVFVAGCCCARQASATSQGNV